jgi:hypothetical protein
MYDFLNTWFCQRDVHHGKSTLHLFLGTTHCDQAMERSAPSTTTQPYYTSPYIATSAVSFIPVVLLAVWNPAEKVQVLASMSVQLDS